MAFSTNKDSSTDHILSNGPSDSISSISFSPHADFLAVASWDHSVRIYQVGIFNNEIQSQGMATYSHSSPILDVCWSKDGSKVFSAGVDNSARMFDVQSGQDVQVAQHDASIRNVRWVEGDVLATGSWDKSIKFWDLRSPAPIGTCQLPERCYSMDVQFPLMVAATADRHLLVYDLSHGVPSQPWNQHLSPLKMQTRVVTCWKPENSSVALNTPFPRGTCYGVGSVEGRTGFHYTSTADVDKNFTFRCHRQNSSAAKQDQSIVYAVNDIAFHPVFGTFATCGSDGLMSFWDKDARMRLKSLELQPAPVTSISFNNTGSMLAYGVSYDWSQGCPPAQKSEIHAGIHIVKEDEVKRKDARR